MSKISSYQLFVITFIFQIGTTIIFGFGGLAGKDAWISQFVSLGIGILVILLYTTLMRMNPGLTLVQWFTAQFGRWIGIPIAFLYPLLFLYTSGRIIADVRDMVTTTILFNTPLFIITGVFVIILTYCIYGGIEVIVRLGEMVFPMALLMLCIQTIFLFSSGVIHMDNLRPFLENGWEPIWKVVYPGGITMSFGETIVLAMFWTNTKHPEKIMKITILATVMAGTVIGILDMLAISVFSDLFSRFLYPLYTLLSTINVGNFIENLQIFGIIYFFTTALVKAMLYMLAALEGIQQLTGMKDYRVLITPACIVALFLGMFMSKNISEHIYFTHMKILVPYIWVPMFLILPSILFIVTWFRQKVLKFKKVI